MFSGLRSRLTYANVVATFALVFAMSGGAYAASKFLITSTKQIKPSVLAQLKGKAGAVGPAGAAGAAGPGGPVGAVGATGPQGPAGAAGAKGDAGAEGKEGKSGKEGKAGVAGSPWAVGGTLPAGKTETGEWAFGPETKTEQVSIPLASFPIELAAGAPPLGEGHAHYINGKGMEVELEEFVEKENPVTKEIEREVIKEKEVVSTVCKGTVAEPTAEPGNLCVYDRSLSGVAAIGTLAFAAVEKTGSLMLIPVESGARGQGTWAVTAATE